MWVCLNTGIMPLQPNHGKDIVLTQILLKVTLLDLFHISERVQFSGTPLVSDYEFEFRIVTNLTLQLLT